MKDNGTYDWDDIKNAIGAIIGSLIFFFILIMGGAH